ncbi:MAG: aminopeptidase P family protein [Geminicoccaceae bacterium]|nr:aminopeptidase P family protein [Geminicoccaceae bacterium]
MALELDAPHFGRHRPRIDPSKRPATGTSWAELGPGDLALGEWAALGLERPDLDAMRRYRLDRLREGLRARGLPAMLLFDPLNIRYATDQTNMQAWCAHNAVRYAFVAAEGPVVLFDFHNCEHLSGHLPLIDEVRPGIASAWFFAGERGPERAKAWALEIDSLLREAGGRDRRLAVDRLEPETAAALEDAGIEVQDAWETTELARRLKSPDEVRAMRCAVAACEAGIAAMRDALVPGISEQGLWAELHKANIARGGEWIETRLLSSGPRTNPWFQECSSRVVERGDLVAFDTDLIGPYGYCADISRTWVCGDGTFSAEQRGLLDIAEAQIAHNIALVGPGVSLREIGEKAFVLPEGCRKNRYSVMMHGVGLCDEYPSVYYPEDAAVSGYDDVLEPGMTLCVESYVGFEGGSQGVKLEEQVLVTERGIERLSTYPLRDPGR